MTCPDDYNVIMMPFPGDVLAAVRVDADGYPTVYINDYLCPDAKKAALRHELWHFQNGDFFSHLTIYDVERKAAYCCPLDAMPRAFRPLSDAETAQLMVAGAAMTLNAFEISPEFTMPLPMPDPMYTGTPLPPIHEQEVTP